MSHEEFVSALLLLSPGVEWSAPSDCVDITDARISWPEGVAKPTQAEVESKVAEMATQDFRAARKVDAKDRLLFEVNFDQESRIRALEGKAPITRAQYRDALIAEWKRWNS